jgi:hypothetical protein
MKKLSMSLIGLSILSFAIYSCYKPSSSSIPTPKSSYNKVVYVGNLGGEAYSCILCESPIRGRCKNGGPNGTCMPGSGKDCPPIKGKIVIDNALSQGQQLGINFTTESVLNNLYSFRDNYLRNSARGIEYMNLYYLLTDELFDNNIVYSISDAVYIFNTINDYVIPNINELMSNPTSQNILIDNDERDAIINFINWACNLESKQEYKNVINSIRSDFLSQCNKSNQEVNSFITTP